MRGAELDEGSMRHLICVNRNVGKTAAMAALATLLQPVIGVRCARDRRDKGVVRAGLCEGLVRRADSAATGIGPVESTTC